MIGLTNINSFPVLTQETQQWIAFVAQLSCFVHGMIGVLAPRKYHDFYTESKHVFKDEVKDEHLMMLVRQEGLACCNMPIAWFLMTYKNVGYEMAIGTTALFWLVLYTSFLLNEVPQRIGSTLDMFVINTAVFFFVAYATLMETQYAGAAVKMMAGFSLTHGLLVLLSPNRHAKVWGNAQSSDDDLVHFARRRLGADLFASSVYSFALIGGLGNPRACGFTFLAALLGFLMLLPDFKIHKFDLNMLYSWLVGMAFFAITLTIEIPVEVVEVVEEGVKNT